MGSKPVSWCISHFLTADKSRQKEIDELHYKYSGRFASANSLLADMKISMKEQTILPPDKEVLYIMGNRDRLTKVNIARARTTEYGAKFAEIEGTGHLLNYEQPECVAELISGFIS